MPLRLDSLVARAAAAVRILPAVTPQNVLEERKRLTDCLAKGRAPLPEWTYAPPTAADVGAILTAARRELEALGRSPWRDAYAARIDELAAEWALARAVGDRDFGDAARARFSAVDAEVATQARALAEEWITLPSEPARGPLVASDAFGDASLFGRMRAEIVRHKLPFRVVVQPGLGSLAATGERAIFVAQGRMLAAEDIERTVLHEVHGHAFPRARAARLACGLFAVGTARGVDEQEGYALLLEQRHGHFLPRRRRELAARHLAVFWMHEGASFADVARRLVKEAECSVEDAIRMAERAFRGGDGIRPGLGRERVYLETFVAVKRHLDDVPDDEAVLASGQVATEWAPLLRRALRDPTSFR